MPITHPFVSAEPDLEDVTQVRPTNWNANHLFKTDSADPGAPVEGQVWVLATGVSPSRVIALKVFDGGVVRTIASITV